MKVTYSPLIIEIMLHYHTRTTDYGEADNNADAPAVKEATEWLRDNGLLESNAEDAGGRCYDITPKGTTYVGFLQDVQMPVQKWVKP